MDCVAECVGYNFADETDILVVNMIYIPKMELHYKSNLAGPYAA